MFRQSATRRATLLLRSSSSSSKPSTTNSITNRLAAQRRFASTEAGGNAFVPNPPSQKQRSWRNRFVRLGLAGGVIYFYNTSIVFAEEPTLSLRPQPLDSKDAPTLNTIGEKVGLKSEPPTPTSADAQVQQQEEGGLEGLESQAHNEGAFNPETGEINWDCPCLGGMAYGPCGEEFREAFSCFVYSKEEPKGMDCIEKFKGMQDCFRLHPEVYGSELQEDEVDEQLTEQIAQRDREEQAIKAQQQQGQQSTQGDINLAADPAASNLNDAEKRAETTEIRNVNETAQAASQKEEELVPRAWHENDDGEPKTQK